MGVLRSQNKITNLYAHKRDFQRSGKKLNERSQPNRNGFKQKLAKFYIDKTPFPENAEFPSGEIHITLGNAGIIHKIPMKMNTVSRKKYRKIFITKDTVLNHQKYITHGID